MADLDCQIICENEAEHDKRNSLLEDQFGPFVQPTLEKVEYVVSVRFEKKKVHRMFKLKVKRHY